jgi:hypothetical protein
MLIKTLAATAALSMLVCGGSALAAQQKSSAMVGPKQPIPYSQLKAYSKASPKTRASKDWWAGSAATGTSTDTSATTTAGSDMNTAMPPATSASPDTAVNPAPSAAPPSMPVTPPTNAPATEDKNMSDQPGAAAAPPVTPPTEPK